MPESRPAVKSTKAQGLPDSRLEGAAGYGPCRALVTASGALRRAKMEVRGSNPICAS